MPKGPEPYRSGPFGDPGDTAGRGRFPVLSRPSSHGRVILPRWRNTMHPAPLHF